MHAFHSHMTVTYGCVAFYDLFVGHKSFDHTELAGKIKYKITVICQKLGWWSNSVFVVDCFLGMLGGLEQAGGGRKIGGEREGRD